MRWLWKLLPRKHSTSVIFQAQSSLWRCQIGIAAQRPGRIPFTHWLLSNMAGFKQTEIWNAISSMQILNSDLNLSEVCPQRSNWQWVSSCSVNDLMPPYRWWTIIGTNFDQDLWCLNAHNEFYDPTQIVWYIIVTCVAWRLNSSTCRLFGQRLVQETALTTKNPHYQPFVRGTHRGQVTSQRAGDVKIGCHHGANWNVANGRYWSTYKCSIFRKI